MQPTRSKQPDRRGADVETSASMDVACAAAADVWNPALAGFVVDVRCR